jgi:hypothetical protein
MYNHRRAIIEAAGAEACSPAEFIATVNAECPWLDGTEEMSETLGPELLAEQSVKAGLSPRQIQGFIKAYNAQIRTYNDPYETLRTEAYEEFSRALSGCGVADACGDGDYWVNEDSFSSREPVIVVFNGFRFQDATIRRLQDVLSSYAFVIAELRIQSEEGAEVLTLRAR